MKTYKIKGMTCGSCQKTVEDSLSKIDEIDRVKVSLEKNEVEIYSDKVIELFQLQQSIPDNYIISNKEKISLEEEKESKLKQLKPLFLIFLYLFGTSYLLNYNPWNPTNFMLDFMGLFFIVFSFFKFLDLKGFKSSFSMYDPLAKTIPFYGWIYPFLELALGILFLTRIELKLTLIITLIILTITITGVSKSLFQKDEIQCACLGTVLKLPMTLATFIENTIMIFMAISLLITQYQNI